MYPGEALTGLDLVQTITLDEYLDSQRLPMPDLIKLDVEGAELKALDGAKKALVHAKYAILEVSFVERHLGQPIFHDVIDFMASHSFHLHAFPHDLPLGLPVMSCDLLFAKRP